MNNFLQRSLTGILFVVILVIAILWSKYAIATLLGLTSLLGLQEFYGITRTKKTQVSRMLPMAIGAMVYVIVSGIVLFDWPRYILTLCFPLASLFFITELFRKKKRPITNIAYSILGILYISVPFALLNYIPALTGNDQENRLLLLGFFVSLWANDTGAYLTGRAFGRRKLFVRISPNKTWEGFIGGLVIAMAAGYVLSLFVTLLSPMQWIIFSLIIGIFGTLGDLVESMLKRNYNIKDSGRLLPGHGGVLDRFDGVFLSAPMIYLYLEFIIRL